MLQLCPVQNLNFHHNLQESLSAKTGFDYAAHSATLQIQFIGWSGWRCDRNLGTVMAVIWYLGEGEMHTPRCGCG